MSYNKHGHWSMVPDSIGTCGRNYTDKDFSLTTLENDVREREAQIARLIASGKTPRPQLLARIEQIKAEIATRKDKQQ